MLRLAERFGWPITAAGAPWRTLLWRDFKLYLVYAIDRAEEDEHAEDPAAQPKPGLGKPPARVEDLPVLAGN